MLMGTAVSVLSESRLMHIIFRIKYHKQESLVARHTPVRSLNL